METNAPALAAWLDDFFASYYRHRPVNATFIGIHMYDDRLPDYSEKGIAAVLAEMTSLRRRLKALLPEPLTMAESLDRQLAEGFLEIQEWEYRSNHFQQGNPCVYTGEAIFGVISLFLRPFAPLEQRVESAIHRLQALPKLLAQGKTNIRQAPSAWTERAIRECIGGLAFFKNGIESFVAESGAAGSRLRAAADTAGAALADFQHYLETDLRRHPREEYACGAETFELLLRKGHFLSRDARQVEKEAWEQLAASEQSLNEHAREFGAANWRDALARLADDHPTADRYYARHDELWEACRQAVQERNLLTWPDYPLRFVPRPHWAREAAPYLYFLSYRAPAPFDDAPVDEYLIPPLPEGVSPSEQERFLRATNESVIKLNHVVHHAAIGHHVQNWHAHHADSKVGRIAAVDGASRIAFFCGGTMAEGWACYATDLADEAGLLTPLEHYSLYQYRLRMAARAIVDVRLHRGEFTLKEAADFYLNRAGMSAEAAHAEAVKNSMFPGAAMMYMVGTNLIHELRREMAARQGAAFDLRRFHDRFLSFGSVPVSLICAAMKGENDNAAHP